jgi:hypothetical protein
MQRKWTISGTTAMICLRITAFCVIQNRGASRPHQALQISKRGSSLGKIIHEGTCSLPAGCKLLRGLHDHPGRDLWDAPTGDKQCRRGTSCAVGLQLGARSIVVPSCRRGLMRGQAVHVAPFHVTDQVCSHHLYATARWRRSKAADSLEGVSQIPYTQSDLHSNCDFPHQAATLSLFRIQLLIAP